MFYPWGRDISSDIAVHAIQLPGRENRIRESNITSIDQIVESLVPILSPLIDCPYAMFGHSMGGSIAFETARALRRKGIPLPVHLAISARIAPHLKQRHKPADELTDDQLLDRMRRTGGLPSHVESEPELIALMLRTVRMDYRAIDRYSYQQEELLSCPISVHWGNRDLIVNQQEIEAWREHTTAAFSLHEYEGNHFFITQHRSAIQTVIQRAITATLRHYP